ncbi:MAG: hydroxymethylbilane synthase [Alphaproteobacteria bacterium]|nr:hydroxymethylbilane synthase [Alphaproteobacteria bacterium]
MKKMIRLGTRGSPLALIQAEEIRRHLFEAHPHLSAEGDIEIIPIRTTGDWRPEHKDRRFVEMGGNKGLFTKEIEDALLTGYIDMATHSMKDVASVVPDGLSLCAISPRSDPRDAFIGRKAQTLEDLPAGAVVGTSSLRRQAQILALRRDLRVVPLRGNVETRMQKLEDGLADAIVLAAAGLARLGMTARISSILPVTTMLPAAAQGVLGVEFRDDDAAMRALLAPLIDRDTQLCVMAERAVMRALGGTCQTPAAAYATITPSGLLALEAMVARADGTDLIRLAATGKPEDADQIGEMLGENLRRRSPADLFVT